ncbi:Endonuclease, Uma2 family (restriction endonuclease fold) [Cohnella sp. OV330]|uniref:Uma2 family endonuclease n=1 Tax=Cohnella sp. OV330 TaxID=1855288 RepID=UPI0008F422F7|nr:Uma2 family endonuclease [Cohnella sp. OV330]SFB46445.1 Endonuclease, Uma2 family (restriction endonuclease fold) [Cohnella sp. OV330]
MGDGNKKGRDGEDREQVVTYDIYAEMPDDGNRYEIFDGKLELLSPGPNIFHQAISGKLYLLVQSCISDYIVLYSPLDIILSKTNVMQPDLVLVSKDRWEIVSKRGVEGAPDLAVEILSPGSRKRDRVRKHAVYEKHGVPEYWIVDPTARTLEQFVLVDGRFRLGELFEEQDRVVSERFPCVSFAVDELFKGDVLERLASLS